MLPNANHFQYYYAVLKITLIPRFFFYSSLETNRKGPWGLGCIIWIPDWMMITPFRKFLKHITSGTK